MRTIRIGVIDDHAVIRAGVRQLAAEQQDLSVVAEATHGRDAVDLVRRHDIDVLLMDLVTQGGEGVDAMVAVKARRPALPVLIFSGQADTRFATTLLRQGASGYVSKDCDAHDLMTAIRTVHQGRRYLSPAMAWQLADESSAGAKTAPHEQLSERELQVFLHLARGDTIGRIAERICLSVKTVSTYRSRMLEKLRLETNSEVTYYALKQGLIQ